MSNETITEKITARISPDKTTAIEISSGGAMAFANASDVMEFAKMMAIAGVAIPKHLRDNPGACLAVAIQASEWRMSPYAVANKSYSVNDRLAYESQLINAVILRRAPIVGRFQVDYSGEGEKRKCKVSAQLTEGGKAEYESPEIGKITTKNSPLWKADPDQQLFYFASRSMCRRHFPDVLLGVYTMDELQDAQPMRDATPRKNPFALPMAEDTPQADAPEPTTEEAQP